MSTDRPTIDPVVWHPPPHRGLTGPFHRNQVLADAEVWPIPGEGPEDVVVTEDGTVFTGTVDGSILRIADGGDRIDRVAQTDGRPLGVELLTDGRLLVCDADRGLLAVDPDGGAIEALVTEVDGEQLTCTNNAAVENDGTIWFTDSSRRFSVHDHQADFLEHSGTGRLFRRDPDGTVETVLDGLQFANGVALDPAGDTVLVAETGTYRILRVWRHGERAGRSDVFAEVPGFPDNLSTGPTGTIWCAVFAPRMRLLDWLAPRPPALRRAVWAIPDALRPGPPTATIVLGCDRDGTVTHNLQAHGDDRFSTATGAREHDGFLYVGSLTSSAILRHRLGG